MIRRILFSFIALSLLISPATAFAYDSDICKSDPCEQHEVGPLMKDISQACGNLGNCTLQDIETVFINIANYVLGVIGAVVLLMYVIGGIYMLTSAGKSERVQKGKKYLTVSTVGLLIVLFAYVGIFSLKSALQYGTVYYGGSEGGLYSCSSSAMAGEPCDLNSTCTEDLQCVDLCTQQYGGETLEEEYVNTGKYSVFKCVDKSETNNASDDTDPYKPYFDDSSCMTNKCPGDEDVQCCKYYYYKNK